MKIYALSDSTGIRYVGATCRSLSARLSQHIYTAKRTKGRYATNWINSLLKKQEKPVISLIEECEDAVWEEREKYWITELGKSVRLTNTAEGGKGVVRAEQRGLDAVRRSANAKKRVVYCTDMLGDFVAEYDSATTAGQALGISNTAIGNALRHQRSAGGFFWFYKNQPVVLKQRVQKRPVAVYKDNVLIKKVAGITEAANLIGTDRYRLSQKMKAGLPHKGYTAKFIG